VNANYICATGCCDVKFVRNENGRLVGVIVNGHRASLKDHADRFARLYQTLHSRMKHQQCLRADRIEQADRKKFYERDGVLYKVCMDCGRERRLLTEFHPRDSKGCYPSCCKLCRNARDRDRRYKTRRGVYMQRTTVAHDFDPAPPRVTNWEAVKFAMLPRYA
jgi:hypothetical protein